MHQLLSTIAEITDVDAVLKVLRGYGGSVQFLVRREGDDGSGIIQVVGDSWPLALKLEDLPAQEDGEGLDVLDVQDALEEEDEDGQLKGERGFLSLLLELAPHLATPLRVFVTLRRDFWERGMDEWTVQPRAKEIFVDYIPPYEDVLCTILNAISHTDDGVGICIDVDAALASRTATTALPQSVAP